MRALLIIDVQNDFCPGGSLAVPHADTIIPTINKLMDYFPLVVASRDWHPKITSHFHQWPIHCVQNSWGAEYHPLLQKEKIQQEFLKGTEPDTDAYSAFAATNIILGHYLQEHGVTEIYLVGIATEYCVKNSAIDAAGLSFKTYVIQDAIASVSKASEKIALKEMSAQGILFTPSKTIKHKT